MIIAVIVTYEPDLALLREVLVALADQVASAVVVDNGSERADDIAALVRKAEALFVALPRNEGIAFAQNRGVELAFAAGAGDVLFMDQDTILYTGAVDALLATRRSLANEGVRVGAVGPLYRNSHDGQLAPIWRAEGLRLVRVDPERVSGDWIEADFVIASGSLMSADALRAVGLMEESLFIDLVDLEWGFRAFAKGYRHFICRNAKMDHSLGAGQLRFLRRRVTWHTPIRNYYWVRNAITLSRRDYVRFAWRRYFLTHAPRSLVFYTLFADSGSKRLRLMLAGIVDAIRGRGGGLEHR